MTLLWLALAGGLGAVARLVLDGLVREHVGVGWLGTLVVNLSGSFLLGLVGGLAAAALLPDPLRLVLGTGFLGGYTTFSAASVEAVRLAGQRRWLAAVAYGSGTAVAAVALAAAGLGAGLWVGGVAGD